jgi:pilus assembly protein CpaB
MEQVSKKLIIMTVLAAFITTCLIFFYIKKSTTVTQRIQYTNVFTAVKTLPARHKILESDIKPTRMVAENLNPNVVTNKSKIIGKYVKDKIFVGEPLVADRLVEDEKSSLSFNVPEGKRAVSVNVNEQIQVGNLIKVGDFVDVIASFEREDSQDGSNKTTYPRETKTILQNIQVLAIGKDLAETETEKKDPAKTVTLAVSLKEAEKLVYASEYAVIRMALRQAGDKDIIDTKGVERGGIQ